MTRNVQSEELLINFTEIQVGDDQLFAVVYLKSGAFAALKV